MIVIEGLTKSYGRGARPALDGITLSIGGGIFGLLGPNGAGKSTLLRILATLAEPSSGRATVAGHDVRAERAAIRHLLGYLPQEFGFHPRLTAYEHLDYLALLSGLRRGRRARIEAVLEMVNLRDGARKKVGTFSGGMRQRLGIAQALLNRPSLLIMDEPTAGLDPGERVRFRTLLAELAGTTTILLSTHIVADVASACGDLAVLQAGRVRFRGAPTALAAHASGRVWEALISPSQLPMVEAVCTVAAAAVTPEGIVARLVGTPPRDLRVRALEPSLEDGYLALLGPAGEVTAPQPPLVAAMPAAELLAVAGGTR